jgi:integrase/recombinase XerD
MRRTTIKNASEVRRATFEEAEASFLKHCKIKNLSPQTLKYYEEDLRFFHANMPVRYMDEVTQEKFESFIVAELDAGKKVTSLNTRIRGLRVFFKFCAEREYMGAVTLKLMKEDEVIKEPYTEAELRRLLKRPASNKWAEWRTWAAINYLIATGNRAGTVTNVKIQDVDLEGMTIHLTKVKNRRQQLVPLSPALSAILSDYLKTWDWTPEDYLFPSNEGVQLNLRSFQSAISRYNISRGVTKTSIHLFRHTFAKNFILAGGGMIQLQALLGHSTMDMTRHYVNIYGMDLQRDFERLNPLDNLIKGGANA